MSTGVLCFVCVLMETLSNKLRLKKNTLHRIIIIIIISINNDIENYYNYLFIQCGGILVQISMNFIVVVLLKVSDSESEYSDVNHNSVTQFL